MADRGTASAKSNSQKKPSVLIIGGLGFIGRHLVHHIHTKSLASTYRIVDKVIPQLAHLAPEFKDCCDSAHFVQADASREASLPRVFDHPDVPGGQWDFVFNLGGETAWAQSAEVYKLRTTRLSEVLGKEAAKRKVGVFVEVSTGLVYGPERKARVETDKVKPWLRLAQAKLDAEQALARIDGLNLIILRLAHVYGAYDSGYLAKALCLARVYQEKDKELKWLWTEDLRINTVWVGDVVRALWMAAEWRRDHDSINTAAGAPASPTKAKRKPSLLGGGSKDNAVSRSSQSKSTNTTSPASTSSSSPSPPPIFNIVDHGSFSQGHLSRLISTVFSIKTGFQGTLISQFAKLNLDHVVDDLNDEILEPWAQLCADKGISGGPLSPFLEKELLRDNDLSLDGGLFERVVGFGYGREGGLDEEGVREMVGSYERVGWWP